MLIFTFLYLLILGAAVSHVSADDDIAPSKIGNFSLRTSQQPGPLVGFGENIIEKGEIQLSVFADAYIGNNNHNTDIDPAFLYGISDNFSIQLSAGYAPSNKSRSDKSSGIEDVFIQLEYAFYNKSCKYFTNQATIVGNVSLPTGSATKNPQTGYGSTSCMLGLTYNHTEIDWFYFGATGIVVVTDKSFKSGDQFLYQIGIGRNICYSKDWIYAWMTEFIGQYTEQGIANNHKNPNSGGNVISIIPSLWLSSEKLILQLGAGYPIVQNLFGNQPKQQFSLFFNFVWSL